ncbi:MAG: HEAT repeat domain-containing protein [Longimicrobiaceae bacterium]
MTAEPVAPLAAPDREWAEQVSDLLSALSKALRAVQLYEPSNPTLVRFLDSLRARLRGLWSSFSSLPLKVDERAISWEGEPVYQDEGRNDLSFLLFRDGLREVTIYPGFEDEEIDRFLDILAGVLRVKAEEDDLITLLWNHDFSHLRYRYVDLLAEQGKLAAPSSEPPGAIDSAEVQSEAGAGAAVVSSLRPEDFKESLYFLDQAEMSRLLEEVRKEHERPLWRDVLNALFDRFEDGSAERRVRILKVLGEILPLLLTGARFREAALLLREMGQIATPQGRLSPGVVEGLREIHAGLARPEMVRELADMLEEAPRAVAREELAEFVGLLPPEALPALLVAEQRTPVAATREVLAESCLSLARRFPGQVLSFSSDPDPTLAAAACRYAGRLRIPGAVGAASSLLERPEPLVRLAAVETLRDTRTSEAGGALVRAASDRDREVRVAAARALAVLRYRPGREQLATMVSSKRLRDADLTERIAFFEAFGAVADDKGVRKLERVLNGKSWLGRREDPETRACAALALGKVAGAGGATALSAAALDPEPVVRSAVSRAMRGEE